MWLLIRFLGRSLPKFFLDIFDIRASFDELKPRWNSLLSRYRARRRAAGD
jgi:hypothetical protein